jgi:hypothetical protein
MRIFLSLTTLAGLLLSVPASANGFQLVIEGASGPAVETFRRQVERLVPPRMKSIIGAPVYLRFEALDRTASLQVHCPREKLVQVEVPRRQLLAKVRTRFLSNLPGRPYTIILHHHLRTVIEAGEARAQSYPCGHGNTYRLATATVLHELTHLFDFSESLMTREDRYHLQSCKNEEEQSRGDGGSLSPRCQEILSLIGQVSERRRYKNLTGFSGSSNKNKNLVLSADPYEYSSPREHFAVNMEYFLLDPNFACRKPALYQFYSSLLQHQPFGTPRCNPMREVLGSSTGLPVLLDPSRAYEVHYLFASKGRQFMSRWGHAMIRVVMCAPERATVGPECLQDIAHHVVISFRANIEGAVINYWDGLTGKYPSQLLIVSMGEVVDEYTRREMRDLISLPLKISRPQMEMLVNRALDQYWAYAGKFYFLSNNCATETDQLIKGVIGEYHPYQDRYPMSPLGIYDDLRWTRLTDESLLRNRAEAAAKGYFFPSQQPALERAFAFTKAARSNAYSNVDEYLEKSVAAERRKLFTETDGSSQSAAAFYLLEKAVQRRMESGLQKSAVRMVVDYEKNSKAVDNAGAAGLVERIARIRDGLQPWNLVNGTGSYGVPLASEVVDADARARMMQDFIDTMEQLNEFTKHTFTDASREMERVQENLEVFRKGLR